MNNETHTSIWLKIAQYYLTPRRQRTPYQRDTTNNGLCNAYKNVIDEELPTASPEFQWEAYNNMNRFFIACTPESKIHNDYYWLPLETPNSDKARATMALLISHMTYHEFKELVNL